MSRLFDGWGIGAIERAMKALARLAPDGGLLALTATLGSDSRFVHQKLRLLTDATRKMDWEDAAESIEVVYRQTGTIYELSQSIAKDLVLLESNPLDDIRHGAMLTRTLKRIPMWASKVTRPDGPKLGEAIAYSEHRVPGLVQILSEQFNSGLWCHDQDALPASAECTRHRASSTVKGGLGIWQLSGRP